MTKNELGSPANFWKAAPSRRNFLALAGGVAAAVGGSSLIAGCGSSAPQTGVKADTNGRLPTKTRFVVATGPGDNYLIDQVNQAHKDYSEFNLDVPKFVYPQSGVQALQLLVAGAINGIMSDASISLINFANAQPGSRPVIIGMRMPATTYAIVVKSGVDANATFEDRVRSLKGKRIGVTAIGAGAHVQLKTALKAAGMAPGDVTAVAVGPYIAAIPQMKANRLDGYMGQTAASAQIIAEETGGTVLATFADEGTPAILRDQPVGAILANEEYAKENEAAMKAFLAAQWAGKDWIVENQAAAAKLLNETQFAGKYQAASEKAIDFFAKTVVPRMSPMFAVKRENVDSLNTLLLQAGLLKSAVNYEDIVPSFAQAK